MRTVLTTLFLLAAGAAQSVAAAESQWQLMPRGGSGDIDLKPAYRVADHGRADADTFTFGCSFGVVSPIGVMLEIGADFAGEFDFFGALDSYSLSQQFGAVGYQFEWGDGWRFLPKVGRTRWSLRSDEGFFLNPGPEESREIHGYEYYWEASISKQISQVVSLGMHYKQGDYEFGRARSTNFLVTIAF